MKATGIVRKIDNLSRVVIPKELRKTMNIGIKNPIEIFVSESGNIVLEKYKPVCVFCGSKEEVVEYDDKIICKKCIRELREIKDQ